MDISSKLQYPKYQTQSIVICMHCQINNHTIVSCTGSCHKSRTYNVCTKSNDVHLFVKGDTSSAETEKGRGAVQDSK